MDGSLALAFSVSVESIDAQSTQKHARAHAVCQHLDANVSNSSLTSRFLFCKAGLRRSDADESVHHLL